MKKNSELKLFKNNYSEYFNSILEEYNRKLKPNVYIYKYEHHFYIFNQLELIVTTSTITHTINNLELNNLVDIEL